MGSPGLGFQRGELRTVRQRDPGQMLPCQCLMNTRGGLTGQRSLVPAALWWIYWRLPRPASSLLPPPTPPPTGSSGSVGSPSTWGYYRPLLSQMVEASGSSWRKVNQVRDRKAKGNYDATVFGAGPCEVCKKRWTPAPEAEKAG